MEPIMNPEITFALLAWWLLKGSLLVVVAWALSRAAAARPAAVRHAIWAIAVLAQLLVPLGDGLAPGWLPAVPVLPGMSQRLAADTHAGRDRPSAGPAGAEAAPQAHVPGLEVDADTSSAADAVAGPPATAVSEARSRALGILASELAAPRPGLGWLLLAGALAVAARVLTGHLGVSRLERRAARVTDGVWLAELQRCCARLGVSRPVTLLAGPEVAIPFTWGIVYPRVLLPASALEWTAETRRHVLLHELAHVRRWDALTQLLAQLALALAWFNPLAWWALARVRREAENACDDRVLGAGERPSGYAGTLLALSRNLHGDAGEAPAGLAMARRAGLEARVVAIVDPHREARSSRGLLAAAIGASVALTLPVIAVRLGAGEGVPQLAAEEVAGTRPLVLASGQTAVGRRAGTETDCRPLAIADFPFASTSGMLTLDDGTTRHYLFLRPEADRCLEASFSLGARFTADDADLVPTVGLDVLIREVTADAERAVWLGERHGRLTRRYLRDGEVAAWDGDAVAWYRERLGELIGLSSAGAADRVARILEKGGVAAVYAEVADLASPEVRREYLLALAALLDADELPRAELIAMARETIGGDRSAIGGFLAELASREGSEASTRAEVLVATAELRDVADRATVLARLLRLPGRAPRADALAAARELLPGDSWLLPFLLDAQPFAFASDRALHGPYLAAVASLSKPAARRELLAELSSRDLPASARARLQETAGR
jgi:beta-lactamase regulating signal transducer with metallopeptidase domain